jgi:hypothetical protein
MADTGAGDVLAARPGDSSLRPHAVQPDEVDPGPSGGPQTMSVAGFAVCMTWVCVETGAGSARGHWGEGAKPVQGEQRTAQGELAYR